MDYAVYADRHNWTPEQVDNLPLVVEPWLLPIENLLEEVRELNREKRREAEKGRRQ